MSEAEEERRVGTDNKLLHSDVIIERQSSTAEKNDKEKHDGTRKECESDIDVVHPPVQPRDSTSQQSQEATTLSSIATVIDSRNCDEQQAVVEASGKKLLTVSDQTTLTTKSLFSFSKNKVVTVETHWNYEESQKPSERSQAGNLEHRPTSQSQRSDHASTTVHVVRRKRYKRTQRHGECFSNSTSLSLNTSGFCLA